MFTPSHARERLALSPDLSLNWVYYTNDAYEGAQFSPPFTRPAAAARPVAAWRQWRNEIWEAHCDDPGVSPARLRGLDGPEFISLDDSPDLQRRCVDSWPDFLHWWRQAKPFMIKAIADSVRRLADDQQVPALDIHVIALDEAQDLAGSGRHHLVSVGLLRRNDEFGSWLGNQLG